MKAIFFLVSIGMCHLSIAQNDSILPNLSGSYCIQTVTQVNITFVSTGESIQFVNDTPAEDTLSVLYEGDTIATLALDGDKVFIKRTSYPFNPVYVGFRPDFGSGYELLYDFGLNVGDTAYSQYNPNDAIVQSIDFVNVQGVQRRRLNLSNGESWIKGMGSTYHPLSPKMYYFEVGYILCSAELEYSGISPIDTSSYSTPCNCATIGLDELNESDPILISPNPTNLNRVQIFSEDELLELSVTDMEGKSRNVSFDFIDQSLEISNLRSGVYFVTIRTNRGVQHRKLIVTE